MTDQRRSHEHLYDVPIEDLDLSDIAVKALKRTAMTTVGDCIDFHQISANAMITVRWPLFQVMDGEVEQKMKAHGYWSFVERDRE